MAWLLGIMALAFALAWGLVSVVIRYLEDRSGLWPDDPTAGGPRP
jgi:hypothetical protein